MEETKQDPYMVEQVIKYSDGTETSIKYRGVIVDGVLISEKVEEEAVVKEEAVAEAPAPEAESASEVSNSEAPVIGEEAV